VSIVKSPDSIIAAFDVGSNSIKMTVARRADHDAVEEFAWESETVRLGAGLGQSGSLAADRVEQAVQTVSRFAAGARAAGATRLLGVATEAVRVAANGAALLKRLQHEAGVEITTISGDREAELTFRGLAASLDVSGRLLVSDIGGGSTELILAENGHMRAARSIALGSGRLTDLHVSHDPPTAAELRACRDDAAHHLAPVSLPEGPSLRLIVVGGTGEYLMRLVPGERAATPDDIDTVLTRLTSISAMRLAELISIPETRARVLPAGVAIVESLADRTCPDVIEGARSGIRTGLLMAAFAGEI